MDKSKQIAKAVYILNNGGIIIFPTDTAFGIGCRIDNLNAVHKLFRLRKRPESQAVPVLVDSLKMAEKYLDSPLPNNVRHMINDYWPGSVTVICKCKKKMVYPLVRAGGQTLGVRMPDHQIILEIINRVGVPVLGPSANFHSDPTVYDQKDLNPDLVRLVDFVVSGNCKLNQASTVVDTTTDPWKILRQGKVNINIDKYNR